MMTQCTKFPIVGIGASAGGIKALEGLFRGMPKAPGLGFVLVSHLSPTRESMLPEIIARYTRLKVIRITDGAQVECDQVYVLSSDALLTIEGGRLTLQSQNAARRQRKPIDVFFSSLAEDQGELSVGIILSGGDSDGSLGLKAIKEYGGLTFAQVAKGGAGPSHPDMPNSAIMAGCVDFAVPAEKMGLLLVEFVHSTLMLDNTGQASGKGAGGLGLDAARREICSIVHRRTGHDFTGYKSKTFMRRVQRRMHVMQSSTIEGYIALLQHTPNEAGALFRDLLINVTNFFRDAEAFDKLATEVVPKLFENRETGDSIRVWVPGCATGEEAFSIGILLREYSEQLKSAPRVQIFATDIDDEALNIARAARYPVQLLDGVSAERRKRFFIPDGGSFIVAKEIRDLCIFSPHSVIKDPPFSRMDLVSCRNLLIYFGAAVQNQTFPTFHYALRPGGYLFLGMSENIGQFDDLFMPIEKKHRIFLRRPDTGGLLRLPMMIPGLRSEQTTELRPRRTQLPGAALRQLVDSQVIERFAPPHVLADRDGDVVYFSPRTGKFLEPAPGVPSRQILTMARKGVRLDLRAVFRESVEFNRTVTRESIAVEEDDGRVQMINLTVEPLSASSPTGEPLFLILFVNQGPVISREEALNRVHTVHDGTTHQIEQELRETRERLQSMIEEYETALEELKSSNEELVSVNEELQSTNEELEASKEELVSVNEELHTVNAELSGKVDALHHANSDLQNLFDSTAIATVFLDSQLLIRSFTPAMIEVFNILPSDCGRPLTDLSCRLQLSRLTEDIDTVFAENRSVERQIDCDDHSAYYLVRCSPYLDQGRRIAGVVITFVNITAMRRAEAWQQVLIAELQHRSRNLLAVVQSIAQETLGEGSQVEAFSHRLAALGRLQGLLGRAANDQIDLAEIIHLEVDTLGRNHLNKVTFSGPPVPLNLDYVQVIALAIHELATNAMKYGALKGDEGRLRIQWQVVDDAKDPAMLVLEWCESELPHPPNASRHGYGRKLIEQALVYALHAKTELIFGSDNIMYRIQLPLTQRTQRKLNHDHSSSDPPPRRPLHFPRGG